MEMQVSIVAVLLAPRLLIQLTTFGSEQLIKQQVLRSAKKCLVSTPFAALRRDPRCRRCRQPERFPDLSRILLAISLTVCEGNRGVFTRSELIGKALTLAGKAAHVKGG